MKILDIIKKGKYYTIILDDKSEYNIHPEIIIKNELKSNSEIDSNKLEKVIEENFLFIAKNSAMLFLGRRQHSRKELFDKLLKKKFNKNTIEKVLDILEKLSLINDVQFTELYTKELFEKKHEGIKKIRSRLYAKGINKEIIDKVLSEYTESEDIAENAFLIARKKLDILLKRNLPRDKIKQKIFSYLLGKGYDYENITEVLIKLDLK